MKFYRSFLLFGIVIFLGFVFGAEPLSSFDGNFSEGFESGAFATNDWTSIGGATTNWVLGLSDPHSGTYSAYASDTDAESVLSTGINTSGYDEIYFSFWHTTSALDAGEYLRVDWYNGTNWITVLDLTNNNTEYRFANFSLPDSASDNEDFAIRFRCNVNLPNEFCGVDDISVLGSEILGIDLVDIYLLNHDDERILELNNTAAETSDIMVINFSVDHVDPIDSWYLNFSANGTNACALGNRQSSVCYAYPEWIQFVNGSMTETFDGEKESFSDYVRAYLNEGATSNFSFIIDEHYNPNVFKWYDADFNFSDEKCLNESQYRIGGDNMLKIEINSSLVPTDMDFARVDLRVNHSGTPEKLEMFACNSSLVNQDPHVYSGCQLIGEMEHYELYEDGTKFKAFFSKNLIDEIGDFEYVVLHSESIGDDYYYIRSYGIGNEGYSVHWQYSNDYGVTWNTSDERYETQLNVNWFYSGNEDSKTAFVYRFWANTTSGYEGYLEGNLTWNIDAVQNYPPLVIFNNPEPLHYFSIPHNMSFIISDTNNDPLNVSLYLYQNETLNKTIFSGENETISEFYCNDTVVDGFYTLLLEACETNTTELYCRNSTREIAIDNNFPIVSGLYPLENEMFYDNVTNNIEISANVSDLSVRSVVANITYPTGVVEELNLTNGIGDEYNSSFEIPLIVGRYNVTIVATDYVDNVNDTEETYFILQDVSSPIVNLEYPVGNLFSDAKNITISASILDSSSIDSIYANVIYPNSTNVLVEGFRKCVHGDDFNADSMGSNWTFREESVASGHECFADINNVFEGRLSLEINGSALEGNTVCGVSSVNFLDGDFDINITFSIDEIGEDSIFVFRVNDLDELFSAGNRVFISFKKTEGLKYYRFGFVNESGLNIEQVLTNDTHGKMRIKRYNTSNAGTPVFDLYYWDNVNNVWILQVDSISVPESGRAQHVQLFLESVENGLGNISMNVDDFSFGGNDLYFSFFEPPILDGIYNVTFFVNDSLGNVNDTEIVWFNLSIVNTEPSHPLITSPTGNAVLSGVEVISWGNVIDYEMDSLKFNISLLNADGSFNSTIVSDYGDAETVRYLWNTSDYVDGEYKLEVVVFENETDELYSSDSGDFIGTFFIDNTNPEIEFLGATTSSGTYSVGDVEFNVSFSDLNLDRVIVSFYSGSYFSSLSSTISAFSGNFVAPSSGVYYLVATVYDLADNEASTEIREIIVNLDGGGSSGGGGGSLNIPYVDSKSLQKGYMGLFAVGKMAHLSFGDSIHKLEVLDCDVDCAVVRIYSDVIEKKMYVGESWLVDVNSDLIYDLKVILNSVNPGKFANLTIHKINESVIEDSDFDSEVEVETIVEEEDSGIAYDEISETGEGVFRLTGNVVGDFVENNGRKLVVALVLIVVAFLLFLILTKKGNRKNNKKIIKRMFSKKRSVKETDIRFLSKLDRINSR